MSGMKYIFPWGSAMARTSVVIGIAVLGLSLLVGAGVSQEGRRGKGTLPANWKKLGLTQEQEVKIRNISLEYRVKIQDLEKQIDDLKTRQKREQFNVLTEDQKDKLRKLVVGDTTPPKK
jgi:hypothetical protein